MAAGIFTSSRKFSYEKEIQAPYETVLKIIQDPYQLCRPNPLITSVVQDKDEADWYIITDRLPIVGPFTTTTTYRAKIVPVENGVSAETHAAMGVHVMASYLVERGEEEGKCTLKESTVVEASFILMPYVYPTLSKAHRGHLNVMDIAAQNATLAAGELPKA